MPQDKQFIPDGPIPGENYTSDTKNYPWHRPPEIDDLDDAIEESIRALTEKDRAFSLLTMLQSGVSVVQATDIFVTSGIGKGKWTPDYAILIAGPVAKTIQIMADKYGIKYKMGLEDEPQGSMALIREKAKLDRAKVASVAEEVDTDSIISEASEKLSQEQVPTSEPIPTGFSNNQEMGDY